MSWSTFLLTLRGRWLVIAALTVLTTTAAGVASWLSPPTFAATATLLVDVAGYDDLAALPQTATAPEGSSAPKPLYFSYRRGLPNLAAAERRLAVQAGIATSDEVARLVVRAQGLAEDPTFIAAWKADGGEGDFVDWFADRLSRGLSVSIPPRTSVIQMTYFSTDPRGAAGVANAFAAGVLLANESLRKQSTEPAIRDLTRHAEQSREKLRAAWESVLSFQRKHQLLTITEVLEPTTSRLLASLVPGQARAEATSNAARNRSRVIERQAALAPGRDQLNPTVDELADEIVRGRAELEAARKQRGAAHPLVQQMQENLAERERYLAREIDRLKDEARSSAESEEAVTASTTAELSRQTREAQARQALQREAIVLFRKLAQAQALSEDADQTLEEARLRNVLKGSDVSLLSQAFPPVRPVAPNYPSVLGLAALLGLGLGLTAAMLLERVDARVRAPALLLEHGLPLLGRVGRHDLDDNPPPLLKAPSLKLPA